MDGVYYNIFCQACLNWKCNLPRSISISKNKGKSIMTTTLNGNQAAGTAPLEQAIVEAITEARSTCEQGGNDSAGCAVAWDIVEELQAEKSHQQQAKHNKTSLENYCDRHPDSVECLIYDV
jgi:CP12 domain